jgi:hypothetical protein
MTTTMPTTGDLYVTAMESTRVFVDGSDPTSDTRRRRAPNGTSNRLRTTLSVRTCGAPSCFRTKRLRTNAAAWMATWPETILHQRMQLPVRQRLRL